MVDCKVAWRPHRPLGSEVDGYLIWKFLFFSGKNTEDMAEGTNDVSIFALDFGKL